MDLDELIKKFKEDPRQILGPLIFLLFLFGPLLKKFIEKKVEEARRRRQVPNVRSETTRPRTKEIQPEPATPVLEQTLPLEIPEVPRERFEDVEHVAARVNQEADSIASLPSLTANAFSEEALSDSLETAAPAMEVVAQSATHHESFSLEGWSPLEAAIVLGGSFDRPVGLNPN